MPRYVRVDAPKLRQVLINLLGNAIKFTVRVLLSAQPDYTGRPGFCFDIEESDVRVSQHDIGRIFAPFERVRNSGPNDQNSMLQPVTFTVKHKIA